MLGHIATPMPSIPILDPSQILCNLNHQFSPTAPEPPAAYNTFACPGADRTQTCQQATCFCSSTPVKNRVPEARDFRFREVGVMAGQICLLTTKRKDVHLPYRVSGIASGTPYPELAGTASRHFQYGKVGVNFRPVIGRVWQPPIKRMKHGRYRESGRCT